jgi:bacterioferritin-associated ferredoxin
MTCQEAIPFISPLYDGEQVPAIVPQHVKACPQCRQRLKEYAQIDAECRLLNSSVCADEDLPGWLPHAERSGWSRLVGLWSTQVLVPRAAVAVGLVAILGLGLALEVNRNRVQPPAPREQFFQFQLGSSEPGSIWTGVAAERAELPYELHSAHGNVLALVKVLEVRPKQVRMAVRAQRLESKAHLDCQFGDAADAGKCATEVEKLLSLAAEREYSYRPGETLDVSVQGGGHLRLTGRVTSTPQTFTWQNPPAEPETEQLARNTPPAGPISHAAYRPARLVKTASENPCLTLYRPDWGLFVFAFHPFPGSSEAALDNGRVLFELEGKWYYVSPTSGISGGRQGVIYYRLIRGYEPEAALSQMDSPPSDRQASTTHQILPGCSEERHLF